MSDDGDIDFVCSVCGDGGLLFSRPRYCLLCTHYAVSETLAEPRKSKGVKRGRDPTDENNVKRREFNQKKRLIDEKISSTDISDIEYEAFIKSWSLQQ